MLKQVQSAKSLFPVLWFSTKVLKTRIAFHGSKEESRNYRYSKNPVLVLTVAIVSFPVIAIVKGISSWFKKGGEKRFMTNNKSTYPIPFLLSFDHFPKDIILLIREFYLMKERLSKTGM